MSRDILTHRITATGTGADNETRYKALASDAAQKIAQYLAEELPGFTYDGISFDGTDTQYLPYWIRWTNKKWGCELQIAANARATYHGSFSSSWDYGLSFCFRLIQNGIRVADHVIGSNYRVETETSGNIVSAVFDIKIYQIEKLMFTVAFDYIHITSQREKHFESISVSSFTGSYDSETYVGYSRSTSTNNVIGLPETMSWYSQGERRDLNFSSSGTPIWPSKGYYWRPYCWAAHYSAHNCGIALFDGQYVLYQLWSNDANTYVTTTPEATYTVDGQDLPAISTRLLIPCANPFRKLQKPGEVLTW